MHVVSVHIALHLAKSRAISHLVDIDPTDRISRSHKTHLNEVRASHTGFSPVLLLTDITHTAPAKHMHKVLLMQVCIEQKQSGDGTASLKPPPQHDGKA